MITVSNDTIDPVDEPAGDAMGVASGVPTAVLTPIDPPTSAPNHSSRQLPSWVPGLPLCAAAGAAVMVLGSVVPQLSPMLVAIIVGIALRNLVPIHSGLEAGIGLAAKRVLRWGVVLLGLQVSIPTIVGLGPKMLLVVVAAVAVTFFATMAMGRAMHMDRDMYTLIASGFSICGAAAVAGMQGSIRASQEKVAAAVALVVLYGTLMIPATNGLVALFGLGAGDAGTLIGASTHEVAQVVAAAGIAGGGSLLAVAVTVKLARVCLMAPVVAGVSLVRNRHETRLPGTKRPPIVPLFVAGFIAMILVASAGIVPAPVLGGVKLVQQFLLATAMFALGLGVHIKSLMKLGAKPVLLGLFATIVIIAVVVVGILLGFGAQI